MSASTGTQIPKPSNEQDFESICVVLWKCILKDPSVQKVGRRGQSQKGVDLYGYRDRQLDRLVGLQCKLKSGQKKLTEAEVLEEFKLALTFEPTPTEYYILTTADDDQKLQAYARKLASEQAKKGTHIAFYIWGWGTLCDEAYKYPDAIDAFDPNYSAHSKLLLEGQREQTVIMMDIVDNQVRGMSAIEQMLSIVKERLPLTQAGETTGAGNEVEAHLDREIDGYREMTNTGQARTALTLFQSLLHKVQANASGRILFRIKANIGICYLRLERRDEAANILLEAYAHSPDEPRAMANKALALLLKGEWDKVLQLGRENFLSTKVDEHFFSHVVQAAIHVPEISAPLELIPPQHRETASVQIAHVAFLRSRNIIPSWYVEAARAAEKFPEEIYLKQFAAEAILDEATKEPAFAKSGILSSERRAKVSAAAKALTEIWKTISAHHSPVGEEGIGCLTNLITAVRTLGDYPAAIELVKEGLRHDPSTSDFFLRAAIVAIESETKDIDLEAMLERVQDLPEKQLLRLQYLLAKGDWNTISQLGPEVVAMLPATERVPFGVAVELSKVASGDETLFQSRFTEILERIPDDIRAFILFANFGKRFGQDELADVAYERAKALLTSETHFAGRHMIAGYALKRQRWSDVADYLFDHVDMQVDTRELEDLATALVNERPTRQRAVSFFKNLPSRIRRMPKYRHAEGFLHVARGDLKAAETCLRDACVEGRADDFLLLLSVLRQLGKDTEAENALLTVSLATIKGPPSYRIGVAQEVLGVGRTEEALSFGYDVTRRNPGDHDAALKFSGLMFRAFDMHAIPSASLVAKDTAFLIENDEGKNQWFVIEGSEDKLPEGVIVETHPIALKAMGRSQGDYFDLPQAFGREQRWKISQIKHKYIWLFHQITENFETWYPGINGIATFKLNGDDIEPILEQVRKFSETDRAIADLYAEKQIPLVFVASQFHRDPISFSMYLQSHGLPLQTCIGQLNERDEAVSSINDATAGAVLDTLTAWTIACLDLFPVVKAVFGEIAIAHSSIIDLKRFLGDEEFSDARSMSLEWRNGEFYRHLLTREEFETRRDFIRERIEQVQTHCVVVPVDAPASKDGMAEKLSEMFGAEPLHPAAIAAGGRVLVSEDLHYRRWSELMWPIRTAWLQPVLEVALNRGILRHIEYAKYVGQLAQLRHGFVSLRGETLLAMVGDSAPEEMERVTAAAKFIGGPNAHLVTHADAVVEFATLASSSWKMPSLHIQKVLGILLENFVRGRSDQVNSMLLYVYRRVPKWAKCYIIQWIKGHFLSVAPFLKLRDKS